MGCSRPLHYSSRKIHTMSDTLGSLIDKLCTVDLKMWNNQELLYNIRRMDLGEFIMKYYDLVNLRELYKILTKACDLNVQRNQLIAKDIGRLAFTVHNSHYKENLIHSKQFAEFFQRLGKQNHLAFTL